MFILQLFNFLNIKYKIIKYDSKNTINILFMGKTLTKILSYVIRLSVFMKNSILIDIISYQNVTNKTTCITIYILKLLPFNYTLNIFINHNYTINSWNKIFINSLWFERENSEFFNIIFKNAIDNRNLLLPYTMTNSPLLKIFPTLGFKEIYFNIETNSLIYKTISIQI